MRIGIPYIPQEGKPPTVLLTANALRFHAGQNTPLSQAILELDAIRRATHAKAIKTAVFEIPEATGRNKLAVRMQLRRMTEAGGEYEGANEEEKQLLAADLCREELKPKAVKGWRGAPTLEMEEALAEECYFAVFPQLDPERSRFLAAAPPS